MRTVTMTNMCKNVSVNDLIICLIRTAAAGGAVEFQRRISFTPITTTANDDVLVPKTKVNSLSSLKADQNKYSLLYIYIYIYSQEKT